MLPHVVPVAWSRIDRSHTDTTAAATTPPTQPRAADQARTAATTQNDGSDEACRAIIASLCT